MPNPLWRQIATVALSSPEAGGPVYYPKGNNALDVPAIDGIIFPFSEELNIPLRFTLKILRKLNLYGLTKAKRGTNGGYYINRSIKDINYYDVIVATQGPIIINRCLDNPDNYNIERSKNCSIHDQLSLIQENLIRDLKACKFY